jgi:hypothetical protein
MGVYENAQINVKQKDTPTKCHIEMNLDFKMAAYITSLAQIKFMCIYDLNQFHL